MKTRKESSATTADSLVNRETRVRADERAVRRRKKAASLREEGAAQREEGAARREEGAALREDAATLREESADQRELALSIDKKSETARATSGAIVESQLREANERLVVATIQAQTMTEDAEKTTARMAYMAEHDFLTGLPNRALLTDRLERSIAAAQRHGKKVALMYLDLDHFKHINDSIGHSVGDELLRSVAARLQECVRFSDTVSRQGGDEFVVLLTEVEEAQGAMLIAEKLIEAVGQPHLIMSHRLHITLSIGISLYPDDGRTIEALARNADTAMYQAKKNGRNTYRVFTPDMKIRAIARQSIEQALYLALEHGRFLLHYQPKIDLETGGITGAEALVRRRSSGSRLVHPTQFIGVAEDCGLILSIGTWVRHEACRQAQAWLQSGLDLDQIAVNVSARELRGKDFLSGLETILQDTRLDPKRLVVEMTESGLMHDTQHTTAILHALKDLGVQIAIDDFGTGYSSLSYLRSFPIDELKIDQSFVQALDGDAGDAIVRAVIAIGTSLKQRVVAEGIETPTQLALLRTHSCAEGQGYYLGRPVNAARFSALLTKNGRIPRHRAGRVHPGQASYSTS
jgi:diguanylate cyclase (GGDEF)-like protein